MRILRLLLLVSVSQLCLVVQDPLSSQDVKSQAGLTLGTQIYQMGVFGLCLHQLGAVGETEVKRLN